MGRILGIDYGERRCGVALSDPTQLIATPYSVIEWKGLRSLLGEIERISKDQQIERVVIGMPLNMNGTQGPMANTVQEFVNALGKHLAIPVLTWDERLSTRTAEKALLEAGTSRAKRKKLVDKIAAQILLQAYLDRLQEPLHKPGCG